jgi:hypothetical protein
MASRPYTTAEVAALVGRSPDRLLSNVQRLHRDHGMPLPLAGRPYRWDRATFDAWRAGRKPPPAPANDAHAIAPDTEDWRQALAEEYAAPKD